MLRPNSHMAVRGFTLRSSARFCRSVCSSLGGTPLYAPPLHSEAPTAFAAKSIAILPFENLSDDKANAYFAEGVKDEILTKLAAVRDLKVISRTSTAKYQSKPDNLKTVAQELGVFTVLDDRVGDVDPEAGNAAVEPEAQDPSNASRTSSFHQLRSGWSAGSCAGSTARSPGRASTRSRRRRAQPVVRRRPSGSGSAHT